MHLLSKRSQRIKPSPTLAVTAREKELRAQGVDVIGFGAGEPDFDTPDHIKEAAIRALREGKTKYTPATGIPELRQAICDKLRRENNLHYQPDEVVVTVGGKHALYNFFQAVLDPGDEVIIPAPYWVSYPDQVLLSDGRPVIVETKEEDGFRIQPEAIEKAITKKTKVFVLNSPSNPTGAAYSETELKGIAEVIIRNDLLCISDEIYEKIVYDGFRSVSIASFNERIKERTVTVNGASKVFSMTGWRMGYAAGPKEIIRAMGTIQGQVTSNIHTATQYACIAALNGPQDFLDGWLGEFRRRRDFIVRFFNTLPGVSCFNPQGAFYVFPRISCLFGKKVQGKEIRSSIDLANFLLDEARVAVVPGSGFGAEGFIRLSYATSMEKIEEGMRRIEGGMRLFRERDSL